MRAKLEIVPRPDVGRVDAGEVQAALRRERYKESLASDLGIAGDPPAVRVKPPRSSLSGGTIVLALIAAILTFFLILGLMMWRDGNLPRLWPERGFAFAPKGPTTDWIMPSGKVPVTASKPVKAASAPPETPVDAKAEYDAANPKPVPESDDEE